MAQETAHPTLSTHTYIYACMHTYIYTYIYVYTYTYIHISVHTWNTDIKRHSARVDCCGGELCRMSGNGKLNSVFFYSNIIPFIHNPGKSPFLKFCSLMSTGHRLLAVKMNLSRNCLICSHNTSQMWASVLHIIISIGGRIRRPLAWV